MNRSMTPLLLIVLSMLLGTALIFSLSNRSYAQDTVNLVRNPDFIQSGSSGLLDWADQFKNCQTTFKCTVNSTTGWNGSTSLQLSTATTKNNTWSYITGKQLNVKPNQSYDVLTHMKLNQFAMQSHVAIEGYNATSKKWNQITQCPSGINGPLEWKEFSCTITIPGTVSQIRPVLNAGWSTEKGKEAVTLFDAVSIMLSQQGSGLTAGFIPPSGAQP